MSQHLPDKGMLYHTDLHTLHLTAWKLSGLPSRTKAFQVMLSERSLLPLKTPLKQYTKAGGRGSLAGVVKGMRIPFAHL